MYQTYLSIPRFHRLEYLEALLKSYNNDEYDESKAHQAIQHEMQEFEQKKARALRRTIPRTPEGLGTLSECIEMAVHLDLIDRNKRRKPKANLLLDPDKRRHFLIQSLWQVYPRFSQVLLAAREEGYLELPLYNWDEFRRRRGDLHGLEMDRKNFEIVRDFLTQLGLLNWYLISKNRQIIYPTACVATRSELICLAGSVPRIDPVKHLCLHSVGLEMGILTIDNDHYQLSEIQQTFPVGYLIVQTEADQVYIKDHTIPLDDFEQKLWSEYLLLANMVPMLPVIYPTLRNQVCKALGITDQTFDHQLVLLIKKPRRLDIHTLDGTLNYAAHIAHIGKLLPPQTSEGNFIVYLKIERRKTHEPL